MYVFCPQHSDQTGEIVIFVLCGEGSVPPSYSNQASNDMPLAHWSRHDAWLSCLTNMFGLGLASRQDDDAAASEVSRNLKLCQWRDQKKF